MAPDLQSDALPNELRRQRFNIRINHLNHSVIAPLLLKKGAKEVRTPAAKRQLIMSVETSLTTTFRSWDLRVMGPSRFPLALWSGKEPQGFEPWRENRIALAGQPVNHSGKAP